VPDLLPGLSRASTLHNILNCRGPIRHQLLGRAALLTPLLSIIIPAGVPPPSFRLNADDDCVARVMERTTRMRPWIVAVAWLWMPTMSPAVPFGLPSLVIGCHALSTIPLPPLTTTADHLPLARRAMDFFDRSSDPFHAVQTSIDLLKDAGFQELDDGGTAAAAAAASVQRGGRYYYTRNRSTLVAFAVGGQYQPGEGGFKVIGGHTDSPNLRVKPRSRRTADAKSGSSIQVGVECYGGGLWHTWFDRDLGVSGRVFCRGSSGGGGATERRIEQRLVKIDRPILRIPNLAIHLQTDDERKAFKINKEDHLSPILAMAAQRALSVGGSNNRSNGEKEIDDGEEDKPAKSEDMKKAKQDDGWTEYQEPLLLQLLAAELELAAEDIVDFELNLFDVQKASLGGVHSEFVHSARLDNLASCFLAVQALVDVVEHDGYLFNEKDISMVVLYDHEEVGSSSA
jgi:aspartyl aminopeptidase